MTNLREVMESDLGVILEDYINGFALPVILIAPDGTTQEFSANDPDVPRTIPLTGRVAYSRMEQNSDTGLPMRVDNPVVTLRKSSLDRVPLAGENWSVKIPEKPSLSADMKTYFLEYAPRSGDSFAWIQLLLTELEQDTP
jgi:hypothetical protein